MKKNTNIEGRYGKRMGSFLLFLVFLAFSCFLVAIVCETCDIRLMFWIAEQARLGWFLLYLNSYVVLP